MPLHYSDAATGDIAYMVVQTGVFAAQRAWRTVSTLHIRFSLAYESPVTKEILSMRS